MCDQGSLVGLSTQDYRLRLQQLRFFATLINNKTHRDNVLTSLYELSFLALKYPEWYGPNMSRSLNLNLQSSLALISLLVLNRTADIYIVMLPLTLCQLYILLPACWFLVFFLLFLFAIKISISITLPRFFVRKLRLCTVRLVRRLFSSSSFAVPVAAVAAAFQARTQFRVESG